MKFIHIADVHFDRPFVNLADKDGMGELRRLEQRRVFKEIISKVKEEKVDCLFISGDLYEHQYVKKSTIEFINNCFKEIPETKVFIAPGNHDPFLKNSYYSKFSWNDNVVIFNYDGDKIELPDVDIYGYGFNDFSCSGFDLVDKLNNDKANILVIHGTLDGSEEKYNSISKKELEKFDYVAMGHIHKPMYDGKIVYPGSMISLGFDEIWDHGYILGEISLEGLKKEFIKLNSGEFIEKKIDVTKILSIEELIEKINDIKVLENQFVKVVFVGKREFEINTSEIYKLINNERIIKIKNMTEIAYDLEKISRESTLKGIFAKEMLEKINSECSMEEKEILEKAVEIAFDALK